MTTAAPLPTTNSVITVNDLAVQAGEPRVRDLRLAAALGFTDQHTIRRLIRRHESSLATFGEVVSQQDEKLPRGGRPGRSYYLNKRQALFITAKSDTERAALVTVQMVEVFDAVTSGATSASIALPPPPGMIAVRAHTRAIRRRAVAEDVQEGFGAVMLGGVLVRFEVGCQPCPGRRALVILHDGCLAVREVAENHTMPDPGRVRIEAEGPRNDRVRRLHIVPLVGAVI